MRLGRLLAHIPARGGSKRVPSKNLRFLAGRPLLSYAVECGQRCGSIADLYVNTDSDRISALAGSLGCKSYRRPAALGGDEATGEDFTADFIRAMKPDTLLMISPVCPLVEPADVAAAIELYAHSSVDTLITVSTTRLQTFCRDEPVNVEPDGPLAPSQDNPEIVICNWAVTIWNAATFMELYARNRSGYFGRHRQFFPLDPLKSVKISTEADFQLAEHLMRVRQLGVGAAVDQAPRYWSPAAEDGGATGIDSTPAA